MLEAEYTELPAKTARPGEIECLGLAFENEQQRRDYFLDRLGEKLADPEFRQIEGFPVGSTEAILALSDPPYYTACPNPFIAAFVRHYCQSYNPEEPGVMEPYGGDFSSSNRHPVYSFHPYHTKVPPEVIRALIEHYTKPGDLILDGFCGTGMTGVAAREAGRNALIVDLSPVASFISGVNCQSQDGRQALWVFEEIIAAAEQKWGYLYQTEEALQKLSVNYYVWSDIFTCPACDYEFPFFPHGVIHHSNKVETLKSFPCPSCLAPLTVRRIARVVVQEKKQKALVWVNVGKGRERINRLPNEYDLKLAAHLEKIEPLAWYPRDAVNPAGYSAQLAQLGDKAITTVSRFLSHRNLIVFSDLWERVSRIEDVALRNLCRATLTSIFTVISERQGYFGGGGGMSGNLYMPIVRMEKNIYATLRRKLARLKEAERAKENLPTRVLVSNQSTTQLSAIPSATIDYIYTDPPFGANIIYSEVNLMLEAWLQVKTNQEAEAVIDTTRQRNFESYATLLRDCFQEYFRVLKPGHWMTVEFHNATARVWNLLQTAIGESGFVVAGVGVVDKGSTTILADIRPGAVKSDLLISAYKPVAASAEGFRLETGTEQEVWDFVGRYLQQLPLLPKLQPSKEPAEVMVERMGYLLFDRMVAFQVQRGATVPLSAAQFYDELPRRFCLREGMYFLPAQALAYDRYHLAPTTQERTSSD